MSNQGAYKLYPDVGSAGQLASTGVPSRIRSIVNGSTPIPFGRIVSLDTAGNIALGGTTRIAGCSLDCSYIPGATGDSYPADALVAVTDINDVFVTNLAGTAVNGGAVYYSATTGEVRASTANGFAVLQGAKFIGAGAAGSVVAISLTTPSAT